MVMQPVRFPSQSPSNPSVVPLCQESKKLKPHHQLLFARPSAVSVVRMTASVASFSLRCSSFIRPIHLESDDFPYRICKSQPLDVRRTATHGLEEAWESRGVWVTAPRDGFRFADGALPIVLVHAEARPDNILPKVRAHNNVEGVGMLREVCTHDFDVISRLRHQGTLSGFPQPARPSTAW